MPAEYTVAPHNGKWYVIGYIGRGRDGRAQYMPVSDGFSTKEQAIKHVTRIRLIEADQKRELGLWCDKGCPKEI